MVVGVKPVHCRRSLSRKVMIKLSLQSNDTSLSFESKLRGKAPAEKYLSTEQSFFNSSHKNGVNLLYVILPASDSELCFSKSRDAEPRIKKQPGLFHSSTRLLMSGNNSGRLCTSSIHINLSFCDAKNHSASSSFCKSDGLSRSK